jgi:hypothetical protein
MALTLGNGTRMLPAPIEASFRELCCSATLGSSTGTASASSCRPHPSLACEYLVSVAELDLCFDELEVLTIVSTPGLR